LNTLPIHRFKTGAATAMAVVLTGMATLGPAGITLAADNRTDDTAQANDSFDPGARTVHIKLNIPSPQLAQCMPRADVEVIEKLTTEKRGFDVFDITARHVLPNRSYTVFLLEQAGFPFGAAEYIWELNSDARGNGHAEYRLIIQEAFASTIVNGKRTRADLHEIGLWFADPTDDDFCLGPNGGPVTPFDGDDNAGGLAFNSAPPPPLPASPTSR
jgi:hypothetical protein